MAEPEIAASSITRVDRAEREDSILKAASIAGEAQAIYGDLAISSLATALGLSHPYALQRLRQAPVLVLAWWGDRTFPQAQLRLIQLIESRAEIPDLLKACGLNPALRALHPESIKLTYVSVILALNDLPSALIGAALPKGEDRQAFSLLALKSWLDSKADHFAWAVQHLADLPHTGEHLSRLGHLLEYLKAGRPFDPGWTLHVALKTAARWHEHAAIEAGLTRLGLQLSSTIDPGGHPDISDLGDGYTVHALRTPLAIRAEGMVMRNCLRSEAFEFHVRHVAEGRLHLFSVRREGQRVATCSIFGKPAWGLLPGDVQDLKGRLNTAAPAALWMRIKAWAQSHWGASPAEVTPPAPTAPAARTLELRIQAAPAGRPTGFSMARILEQMRDGFERQIRDAVQAGARAAMRTPEVGPYTAEDIAPPQRHPRSRVADEMRARLFPTPQVVVRTRAPDVQELAINLGQIRIGEVRDHDAEPER